MHILHLLDASVPNHSGYTFRTRNILRHQNKMGWTTASVTGLNHVARKTLETIDGLRFYRTRALERSCVRFPPLYQVNVFNRLASRLDEVIKTEKPDVLHAHSPALNGLVALRASRKHKLPVVYECRAFWEDAAVNHGTYAEWSLRYRMDRALESYVFTKADAVTTICEGLGTEITSRGIVQEKITIIPNAVDTEHFTFNTAKDDVLAAKHGLLGSTVIGYIGSFYAYEGIPLLLDSLPLILAQHPDVKLLLVGGGRQETVIQDRVDELRLREHVVLTGRIPHERIQEYYNLVDLMIYPRLQMRLTDLVTPLKPLEAMAHGNIVVASDVGGHRELIRDGVTGKLFSAGSSAALAATVGDLLGHRKQWSAIRRSARDYVERERTWPLSISRYRSVYSSLSGLDISGDRHPPGALRDTEDVEPGRPRTRVECDAMVHLKVRRIRTPGRTVSARRDPGVQKAIRATTRWLCCAQDRSASADGGVASHFNLGAGWSNSYPETTGYLVPTILECARRLGDQSLRDRARRMLDWLVSIQFPNGSFQGGRVGTEPVVPVTFNTGQILIGLAAGRREFGSVYRAPMRKAADWLAETQDADGSWSSHPSPLTAPGAKAYESHTSVGLLKAARVEANQSWVSAALANVDWALSLQSESGWFENCDHELHDEPLTHTIGYVLRAVLEAYLFSGCEKYLEAAHTTGAGLVSALREDGFIPGRLDREWRGTVSWACLTGTSQIAECWLLLFAHTGQSCYRDAALSANGFVRRTLRRFGPAGVRGGISGSFPANGDYCSNQFVNWAAKFLLDSSFLELDLDQSNPTRRER